VTKILQQRVHLASGRACRSVTGRFYLEARYYNSDPTTRTAPPFVGSQALGLAGGDAATIRLMWIGPDGVRRLAQARELLREIREPSRPITAIAREVGVSPFHFIRQFEAIFGETPHQYRIRARLERAKLLLARGDCSVTDACMAVGFSSLGSFSAAFSQRIGEPPSRYQRRVRSQIVVPGRRRQVLFPGCLSLMASLPAGTQFSRSRHG
jgi:AraC-like DNA-binding protein